MPPDHLPKDVEEVGNVGSVENVEEVGKVGKVGNVGKVGEVGNVEYLDRIVLDYLLTGSAGLKEIADKITQRRWRDADKKSIIRNLIALSEFQPDQQATELLYYIIDHLPYELNPPELQSIKNLTARLRELEAQKAKSPKGVRWAYNIFLRWQQEAAQPGNRYTISYLIEDTISSFEASEGLQGGILQAVAAKDEVQADLTEINEQVIRSAVPTRHNQFGAIAAEYADLYHTSVTRKGNREMYDLGIAFRKKALLGSHPEVISGLARLPTNPPKKLVDIVKRSIDEMPRNCRDVVDDQLAMALAELLETVKCAYKEFDESEVSLFIEEFPILTDKTCLDTVKALKKQLFAYASEGLGPAVESIEDARHSLDRVETKSAFLLIHWYRNIERELGAEKANEFRENVDLYTSVGLGRRNEFIRLYGRFILGELDHEEAGRLAPALANLADFAKRKEENERILIDILANGPTKCSKYLREKLREATGIDVERYWDLRRLQKNLYATYPSFLSYQALVDAIFDPSIYLKLAADLDESGCFDKRLISFAGACGIARKEAIILKELRKRGYDIEIILNDNSEPARDLALMTCASEDIYTFPNLPPVVDWDLEKLHPPQFNRFKELLADRQIIFTLCGGIAFNFANTWDTYKRIRDFFMTREHGSLHDKSRLKRALVHCRRTLGERGKGKEPLRRMKGLKPDILITEWNSEKDMEYYYHPYSVEFLNRGITTGYQIFPDHLAQEGPVFILDEPKQRVRSFYILNEGHELNRDGSTPAVLVIDSGKPDEETFDQAMRGVGFSSEFFRYNSTTIAVSQVQKPEKEFEKRVNYLMRSSYGLYLRDL